MPKHISYAFHSELKNILITDIQTTRILSTTICESVKFKSILASIQEIGIVEPLAVYPEDDKYILLDGHLRLLALQALGVEKAVCLISTDDEGFTYNRQINRLSPIQEYRMISKAINKGISPERIAKTLNINTTEIKQKLNLLNDISPGVAAKLADKHVSQATFRILRKMKPMRQLEAVKMMIAANKFTRNYARMIWVGSSPEDLVPDKKPAHKKNNMENLALLEQEMERLKQDYTHTEKEISEIRLSLIVTSGYLGRLLENSAITEFIENNYTDILTALKAVYEQLQQAPMGLEIEE